MSEELLLYLDKCRFCHGDPEILSESLLIDDAVEKRFYFLSNVEVNSKWKAGKNCETKIVFLAVQIFSVPVQQNMRRVSE